MLYKIRVYGNSMSPRLSDGDIIYYDDQLFKKVTPVKNDIVVFAMKDTFYVKQIKAVPGDSIDFFQIDNLFRLDINSTPAVNSLGKPYILSHKNKNMLQGYGPVLKDCYLVMPDSGGFGSHKFGCLNISYFCDLKISNFTQDMNY